MKYLTNSSAIKSELENLFSHSGRKWAVVAYVGYGALDQIPAGTRDLKVVCCPKPGATNPDGVRRLLNHGIEVYFCENLHTKLYWTENVGVIVGSANLSSNALSESGQHEFAVFNADPNFDIEGVLSKLSYAPVTEESLASLDTEHTAITNRHRDSDEQGRKALSFYEASRQMVPRKWKFITWCELRESNELIEQKVLSSTGQSKWVNDNDVAPNKFKVGDFVLQVHVDKKDERIRRANCKWLRVDLIVKHKRSAHAAIQLTSISNGPPPPFEIDSRFKKVIKQLYNESYWEEIIDSQEFVKPEFIHRIQKLYEDA